MKKPVKNYVVLTLIVVVTVVLVFYIRGWYNTSKLYYSQNSVVKDIVSEINNDEIFNYTLESQKFILYTSSGSNLEIKGFEKNLKKVIKEMDISGDVLYLNLDNVNVETFSSYLKNSFAYNQSIASHISDSSVSTLYVFDGGKIIAVLNNANNFNYNQIKTFFKKWGFKND